MLGYPSGAAFPLARSPEAIVNFGTQRNALLLRYQVHEPFDKQTQ